MASQTNGEKLYSEINVLLFDVCHFLTSAVRCEELSPWAKNEAQNLVSRSKEKVDAIAKMQKEVLRIEVDTSNTLDDEFPHHALAPWDLPQCSAKYGPLVTNERTYLIGPKKTVFVALVDCFLLFYKINKKNEGPSDWINVMNYTATALENRKDFAFEITAPGKQRFEFMARSSKDVDQWLAAIKYKKQPVMTSNIPESILESDLCEYWEVEEMENEQPKPLQSNNFAQIEQSSTLPSRAHQTNSFSAYNNNIIVDDKYPEKKHEYYNHSIIVPVETNRANNSLKRFEDIQHVHERVPPLPERSKTNNFHLNKKLYGLSYKVDDVQENNIFNSVCNNGQSSCQQTSTKQSSYLYTQHFRSDENMAEPESNFHDFVQQYPDQSKELFQDTLSVNRSININDMSTKTAVIHEVNKPNEITGNQYKHSISLTNIQSTISSSSLKSWEKELPVHVLPRQISANNNETTFSNQSMIKPEVPVKSLKLNSVKYSSISQKPDEIQNIDELKTFQQIRQHMEHWILNKKK